MSERPLPRTGSSSGPMAGYPVAGHEGDIDKAIESLEREGIAAKQKAQKLIELEHAKEIYKQQLVKGAAIVTGQIQASEGGEMVAPDKDLEKSKSIAVQSVLGGIGAAINLGWIAYFGTDMPAELYAAVPVFVQLIAQATATAYNNRGSK